MVGSVALVLLGVAVTYLGMLPSDTSVYFLIFCGHLLASGTIGAIFAWTKGNVALRLTSIIVNGALAVSVVLLILNGTIIGPAIMAAPLLFGAPAVLNVLFASLRRAP